MYICKFTYEHHQVREMYDGYTLLELHLLTGRTHQVLTCQPSFSKVPHFFHEVLFPKSTHGGKVAKLNEFSSAYQSANIQMFCTG